MLQAEKDSGSPKEGFGSGDPGQSRFTLLTAVSRKENKLAVEEESEGGLERVLDAFIQALMDMPFIARPRSFWHAPLHKSSQTVAEDEGRASSREDIVTKGAILGVRSGRKSKTGLHTWHHDDTSSVTNFGTLEKAERAAVEVIPNFDTGDPRMIWPEDSGRPRHLLQSGPQDFSSSAVEEIPEGGGDDGTVLDGEGEDCAVVDGNEENDPGFAVPDADALEPGGAGVPVAATWTPNGSTVSVSVIVKRLATQTVREDTVFDVACQRALAGVVEGEGTKFRDVPMRQIWVASRVPETDIEAQILAQSTTREPKDSAAETAKVWNKGVLRYLMSKRGVVEVG
ncbi:hypothetical protein B0H14DRAFT_2606541 [Mycena olivaceomarginata]|nr:hypothetical protein B0H14DRAFT_2606541 [Mycena olivaceomarginata]